MWVIHGGPRCGPCFRLARWIEDHHATLDKDYVVVKLMGGVDEHVTEAIAGLPIKDGDGIPWFAITEPDGTVLAISRGPHGQYRISRLRGGNPSFSADARSNRSEDDFRRSRSTRQLAFIGSMSRARSQDGREQVGVIWSRVERVRRDWVRRIARGNAEHAVSDRGEHRDPHCSRAESESGDGAS